MDTIAMDTDHCMTRFVGHDNVYNDVDDVMMMSCKPSTMVMINLWASI